MNLTICKAAKAAENCMDDTENMTYALYSVAIDSRTASRYTSDCKNPLIGAHTGQIECIPDAALEGSPFRLARLGKAPHALLNRSLLL